MNTGALMLGPGASYRSSQLGGQLWQGNFDERRVHSMNTYDDLYRMRLDDSRSSVYYWHSSTTMTLPLNNIGTLIFSLNNREASSLSTPGDTARQLIGTGLAEGGIGLYRRWGGGAISGLIFASWNNLYGPESANWITWLRWEPATLAAIQIGAGREATRLSMDISTEGYDYGFDAVQAYQWTQWQFDGGLRNWRWAVVYHQRRLSEALNSSDDGRFVIEPQIAWEHWKFDLGWQLSEALEMRMAWRQLAVKGSALFYWEERDFGRLTKLNSWEESLELSASMVLQSGDSLLAAIDGGKFTSHQRGHMDPWPFLGLTLFDQSIRIYTSSHGNLRTKGATLRYFHRGGTWLGLRWLRLEPDAELIWQQRIFLVPFGEIHTHTLRLTQVDLLIPSIEKRFDMGNLSVKYGISQAVPVAVKYIGPKPTPIVEKGGTVRGGTYHSLSLTYAF